MENFPYSTMPAKKRQAAALPHEKCNQKEPVPQIENVTQIKADYPASAAIGGQYGGNHERKIAYQAGPFTLPESWAEREIRQLGKAGITC
jgi:hypothetical protein